MDRALTCSVRDWRSDQVYIYYMSKLRLLCSDLITTTGTVRYSISRLILKRIVIEHFPCERTAIG